MVNEHSFILHNLPRDGKAFCDETRIEPTFARLDRLKLRSNETLRSLADAGMIRGGDAEVRQRAEMAEELIRAAGWVAGSWKTSSRDGPTGIVAQAIRGNGSGRT
jgi:hypothetical protein